MNRILFLIFICFFLFFIGISNDSENTLKQQYVAEQAYISEFNVNKLYGDYVIIKVYNEYGILKETYETHKNSIFLVTDDASSVNVISKSNTKIEFNFTKSGETLLMFQNENSEILSIPAMENYKVIISI